MKIGFESLWRGTVRGRGAAYSQRVVVSGAAKGNGAYPGVVGSAFRLKDGFVELQWNDDAGSGWQESAIISSIGMTSPLVTVRFVSADDSFPSDRDGDYDDLQVGFEHIGPLFDVPIRPFALERGSLAMFPDGVFDTSQGVQYMGVRVRNTWFFDWTPALSMSIGIAPASRTALQARDIRVLDAWTPFEQQALGQIMDGGNVHVPELARGEETTIYFKVDVSGAAPGAPEIGFVAQRDAFDPRFDEPTRVVHKKIFISRTGYDPATNELVATLPEGTLRLRLLKVALDRTAANHAAQSMVRCLAHGGHDPWGDRAPCTGRRPFWQDCRDSGTDCREVDAVLRELLLAVKAGRDIDVRRLRTLLTKTSCGHGKNACGCPRKPEEHFPGGGWQGGSGKDGWCRVPPVFWLPVEFEYRFEPDPAYPGQFGPLAFQDPWWKVVLIIIAALLALASIIYDYVFAAQDPQFAIGQVDQLADVNTSKIDAATANLNGSRGVDLGLLDAQGDDVNNGNPIAALDSIVQLDRTDNGDNGLANAVIGNVVWKSGGTSATTRGVVVSTNTMTSINYDDEGGHDTISGTITFTNQVVVNQIVGFEQPLSQGGDSGSTWVDLASGRPVALNFAGPADDSGTSGTGNPIRAVADRLNIRFNP
jgi:hypothetical protein